jgi:hypothetical protein
MQWAEEGEKPFFSFFFFFFFYKSRKKNVTNKTIPKLVNESGNVITDQNQILQETKTYYENLYSKRDTVSNINLKNEIPYTGVPTLSDEIKDNLEGEITYAELTASIKRMKNETSPGSDGFTSEYFKFFWNNLGRFVFRSINYGYKTGQLSITQKLGFITCIPKGDKPRQFMKN